jgi:hydrogenase maturation protease
MSKKTIVLGVGNLLLKDEGIGIHVVQELQKRQLPNGVEVVDGATSGMNLLALFPEASRLIIVDCVKGGKEPGTIYKFTPDEVKKREWRLMTSLHDVNLADVLQLAEQMNEMPEEVVIIGVEPKELDYGVELSPELEAKLPQVIEEVFKELGKET